jgi:RecA/RadA recombinase
MQDQDLDRAIQTIHLRFGSQALRRADSLPAPAPWPVGIAAVERLSGIGGLPCGRLTVFSGTGTCGKLSLALALLARATHDFATAIVIDDRLGFDPWALLPLEPKLEALTVVRPPDEEAAGEAATALAKAGAGFLLTPPVPEAWLNTIESAAARSGAVVVVVAETVVPALAHASSFSLAFERSDWVWDRGQLAGLRANLRCVKNKVGIPGLEAEVEVRYPMGARVFFEQPLRERRWLEPDELEEARSAAV